MTGLRTLLLVDDQPEFRLLARLLLDGQPGVQVIGEAASGEEALELVPRLRPQVVLLDVQMGGMNGFETARRLMDLVPSLRIIITSSDEDPTYEALAQAAQALGFLPKKALSHTALQQLLAPAA